MNDANAKISSYNIHSCVGTDGIYSIVRVARVIGECDSQIVSLQEVEVNGTTGIKTRIWSSPHNDDQPAAIAALAGFSYYAFAPAIRSRAPNQWKESHERVSNLDVCGHFGDEQWERKCEGGFKEPRVGAMGKFGIAILSKYPIKQIQTHQYQRYKKKTIRNAMACLISLPNNNLLWVVNTHLGCHFIGKEQHQQAAELVIFIDSLERHAGVIVCGDLNSLPIFPSIRSLRQSGLCDMYQYCERQGLAIGGTFPSHAKALCLRKLLRLDYIFLKKTGRDIVCKCVYVQDGSRLCSLASDHLPLCAIFFVEPLC